MKFGTGSQRGRKLRVEWQHDAATLEQCYRREPVGEHRTRLHALWLLRLGGRLVEVAPVVGVSPRTLQQWLAWYRQGGLGELRQHRLGGAPGSGAACRLSPAQQEALRDYTRTGTCRRVADAQAWVHAECGQSYSYQGMWQLLRRLGLRLKHPRPQSSQADPHAQEAWKKGAPPDACGAGDPAGAPRGDSGDSGAGGGCGPRAPGGVLGG